MGCKTRFYESIFYIIQDVRRATRILQVLIFEVLASGLPGELLEQHQVGVRLLRGLEGVYNSVLEGVVGQREPNF